MKVTNIPPVPACVQRKLFLFCQATTMYHFSLGIIDVAHHAVVPWWTPFPISGKGASDTEESRSGDPAGDKAPEVTAQTSDETSTTTTTSGDHADNATETRVGLHPSQIYDGGLQTGAECGLKAANAALGGP